ncbi:META domain-containing protein [Pseudoblastomonas flavescens]|nr:META domain-containing protein [Alteriqipengyuania flavescens]WJY19703.1 META domain-containing protein [Alteriqipengyuania flavescens]
MQQRAASGDAMDDGTYLERIDPLGDTWLLRTLAGDDVSDREGVLTGSGGGFLNHHAQCGGGHPAFYQLDGQSISVIRREAVQIGKCGNAAGAADFERRWADFIDNLATWRREGDVLRLADASGTTAVLERPPYAVSALAGRWLVDAIGGEPFAMERRAAAEIEYRYAGVFASAECNTAYGDVSTTGRIDLGAATQQGCSKEDAAEDALLFSALGAVTGYRIDSDRLTLTGGPGLTLRRPPYPDRTLAGEFQSCGNTLLGAYQAGPITLSIARDTMTDQSGCRATYSSEGPNLSLALEDSVQCNEVPKPYVAGEPIEIGGGLSFLSLATPDAFAFTDRGRLVLRTPRGLLHMCRKGDPDAMRF